MKYDIKTPETKGFYVYNKSFYLINSKDERSENFKQFKKENGFSPDETWALYTNIALFVLPRLKYFKEKTCGYPTCFNNIEEWHEILDKMILSFERIVNEEEYPSSEYISKFKDEHEAYEAFDNEIKEGLELFGKYFRSLWW